MFLKKRMVPEFQECPLIPAMWCRPTIRTHTPGCAENSHRPRGHLISRNTGEDSSVNGYTHSSAKTSIAQKLGDRYGGARISRVYESYWLNVSKTHWRIGDTCH